MQTAKVFRYGGSQAVRLLVEFRFDAAEVLITAHALVVNATLMTHHHATA